MSTYRIEVANRVDPRGGLLIKDFVAFGLHGLTKIEVMDVYYLDGELIDEDLHTIARELLCDTVVEEYHIKEPTGFEILYNPGVTDPKTASIKKGVSDLVFPSRSDLKKPRDMHMAFDRAVKRAGLTDVPGAGKLRIHDLRHLCASYLLMTGNDVETVREILGHRDISTTQKYLHVVNEHKKQAISKIGHLGLKDPES